jgi:hypothetical protein|tara:strand:- start:162 stop:398 length:237 start_codon:yes stop_codon:yes gene_type:complete
MASSVPRELADRHLDRIADAYHATVKAFLREDTERMAEGLFMLLVSVKEASHEIGEHLNERHVRVLRAVPEYEGDGGL